jgi:glyoxylate/hydroxypyruvate reductase A
MSSAMTASGGRSCRGHDRASACWGWAGWAARPLGCCERSNCRSPVGTGPGRRTTDWGWNRGPTAWIGSSAVSDVLINLLPLTPDTWGLIDRELLDRLPDDSLLINVGRGAHVVEEDLIDALDRGRPGHAVLDVFHQEPLPDDHPLRRHPRVTVTPHIAARTDPAEAAELALAQWHCVQRGVTPPDAVDRVRGY